MTQIMNDKPKRVKDSRMTRFRRQKKNWITLPRKRSLIKTCLVAFFSVIMLSRLGSSPQLVGGKQQQLRGQISKQRWAYVFLLADVDPERPFYRGLLYNILVSSYSLTKYEESVPPTKAEIVVLVQMASTSKASKLPEEEFLKRMNVKIRYINQNDNRSPSSTFYTLVLAKFEIFKLTEYSKILFLDGDVLPLCNLDYLLELSEKGVLKETVLHAMYEDPVNAGMFVISPSIGYYEEIQSIIQRHGIPSKENWSPRVGWGGRNCRISIVGFKAWFRLGLLLC